MNIGQQILRTAATIPFSLATSTACITSTPILSYINPIVPVQKETEPKKGGTQLWRLSAVVSPSELTVSTPGGPSTHPRIAHLERTMAEYASLRDGWAGDGSSAPSEAALNDMKSIVDQLPTGLPFPIPSVTFDGEPGLFWDEDGYYMDIAFEGANTFSAFVRSKSSSEDEFRQGISIQTDAWQGILLAMSKRFEA